MMLKKSVSRLLVFALCFGLTACAGGGGSSDKLTDSLEEGTAVKTRMFVDDAGREVEIPEDLNAIVASGPLAQIVLLALAPDMLVGLAAQVGESARGIIPEELFDLPYFGQLYGSANLNVEELAAAGPQVIVDIGELKSGVAEDLGSLEEQTTIPAVFVSATLDTMAETYRTLGRLLGREERAEELARFCEKVYSRTVSIMEEVGEEMKRNALYVTGEEGLNVLARGSYHAELIDLLVNNLAVAENPSSKGSGNEVTMDQLLLWDPEVIIFAPGSIYSEVKEMDTWKEMDAIAQGKYVETPSLPYNWVGDPPSVQRYLGLIWLPALLYPEYCNYDVKEEVQEYYRLFYDYELTDEKYETLTAHAFFDTALQ